MLRRDVIETALTALTALAIEESHAEMMCECCLSFRWIISWRRIGRGSRRRCLFRPVVIWHRNRYQLRVVRHRNLYRSRNTIVPNEKEKALMNFLHRTWAILGLHLHPPRFAAMLGQPRRQSDLPACLLLA